MTKRLLALLLLTVVGFSQDQTQTEDWDQFCSRFDARKRRLLLAAYRAGTLPPTGFIAARLGPKVSPTTLPPQASSANIIDTQIFGAISAAGVTPAEPSSDTEFARRVSLDTTGRIPTAARVQQFLDDKNPGKRLQYVDEMLAKPEWADKWVMFLGDLYQNNSKNAQISRYVPGVVAFQSYLKTALIANRPYDQIAKELITASGSNSYQQGNLGYLAGYYMKNGPVQDTWDSQTAGVAEVFLGLGHMDCLLCHNGRGHLDSLSLWGRGIRRDQAWGMASFFSRTLTQSDPANPPQANPRYWSVATNTTRFRTDYPLNTTSGNRPGRTPIGSLTTVAPSYIFGDKKPNSGEDYRVALARFVTTDFQFARATVNYFWEQFFGIGLVTPANAFDPLRLDPANPPKNCSEGAPCTLQASHPELLNALAQAFIDSKYDLKALMRLMVNSNAYQLSSRYDGEWNEAWNRLFARKLVRRLWAEEMHDAVTQATGLLPTYRTVNWGPVSYAMQLPEPSSTPDGTFGPVSRFLDNFLRGDRDEVKRSGEGGISQALALMNDPFVATRMSVTAQGGLLARSITQSDSQLVDTLFLNVLSRPASDAEKQQALTNLRIGNRNTAAEDFLWTLLNKVDFTFNY